jgi:hypothetical protein
MKVIFYILFALITLTTYSQNDSLFSRLQAIRSNGLTFYNVDGIQIIKHNSYIKYSEKGLKKIYRKYKVKKLNKIKDDSLKFDHYYINKIKIITDSLKQFNTYYFIKSHTNRITIIQFNANKKVEKSFKRHFSKLIIQDKISDSIYTSIQTDSLNFAGRKIALNMRCTWQNINNIQCPYNGQMNWSVHKTLKDAQNTVRNQLLHTKSLNGSKIISEKMIPVIFEGTKTNAKKVILEIKGITSILAGMSGGKSLSIYYVATKVRNNYVSCVMSFWNNDNITEKSLSPLLEKVMILQ